MSENYCSFCNSIPVCAMMSPLLGLQKTEETTGMLRAATGWNDLSLEEEFTIGERNYNLARAFTVRESGGKPDDRLPPKISRALGGGPTNGQSISQKDLSEALKEYYKVRRWTKTGAPTKDKLAALGLEQVAEGMTRQGG